MALGRNDGEDGDVGVRPLGLVTWAWAYDGSTDSKMPLSTFAPKLRKRCRRWGRAEEMRTAMQRQASRNSAAARCRASRPDLSKLVTSMEH